MRTTPAVPLSEMPDTEYLLHVLKDGRPHTLNEILRRSFADRGCGLTVHSRAADCRKPEHGSHNVINWRTKGKRGDGSIYQLLPPLESASAYEGPDAVSSGDGREALTPPAFLLGTDGSEAVAAPIPGQLVLEVAA